MRWSFRQLRPGIPLIARDHELSEHASVEATFCVLRYRQGADRPRDVAPGFAAIDGLFDSRASSNHAAALQDLNRRRVRGCGNHREAAPIIIRAAKTPL